METESGSTGSPTSSAGTLYCVVTRTGNSSSQETEGLTSLCSAIYVCCKRDITHICCWVPCCSSVLLQHQLHSNQSISPTSRAHSSKPTTRCCIGWTGRMDGQTSRCFTVSHIPQTPQAVPTRRHGTITTLAMPQWKWYSVVNSQ